MEKMASDRVLECEGLAPVSDALSLDDAWEEWPDHHPHVGAVSTCCCIVSNRVTSDRVLECEGLAPVSDAPSLDGAWEEWLDHHPQVGAVSTC